VKALYQFADRLQGRYEIAKSQVGRLTQSILAKAFRGELVPTEAELAKAEGRSYETAEELLKRVSATSKNGASPSRRPRRVNVGA
jgi:type I restriction enzyme S subunit